MRKSNRSRTALLSVALLAAAGVAGSAVAQDALTEAEVRAKIEAQGFTNIHDVEFDDGIWTADARSADGTRVDLSIDPATGEVYPDSQVSKLGKSDIEARLAAAGYSNVHDVEFDDGLWKAEAHDSNGNDVELRMEPTEGRIIGQKRD